MRKKLKLMDASFSIISAYLIFYFSKINRYITIVGIYTIVGNNVMFL